MSSASLAGKVVLITGASAGIGAALGREASAQGAHVVLLARRAERVVELARALSEAGPEALGLGCDVTRDGELEAAVERTRSVFGGVDVSIANAGFGVSGALSELSLDDYRRQFETNVFGVIRTAQATRVELEKRAGSFAVVGSANGYLSVPRWSAYCMSKHAVRSFCASIQHEFEPKGVSVTHLVLGFVDSDFRRVKNDGTFQPETPDPVPSWLAMPAHRAARQMLEAIASRRAEATITGHARFAVDAQRFVPQLTSLALGLSGKVVQRLSKRAR